MKNNRKIYSNSLLHIYNRGSKKEYIFFTREDYERFIQKLFYFSKQTKDEIIQFCLLPNHYHILVKAHDSRSIPLLMKKLQISHIRYLSYKYRIIGRIFQNRYKTIKINSNSQLLVLSRYIHRNPYEYFESISTYINYPWSSYLDFLSTNKILIKKKNKDIILSHFVSLEEYREFVETDELAFQKLLKSREYSRDMFMRTVD